MQETNLHREPPNAVEAGHELSDLQPGRIVLFGVGIVIATGLAVVITSLFIHYRATQYAKQEIPLPRLAKEREVTPQPRLEVNAPRGLREMRAGEQATLSSYGWVDKDGGVVRIPVDRAMEILADKGLPVRPQDSTRQRPSEKRRSDGAAQ
jgi:hypothetical protein